MNRFLRYCRTGCDGFQNDAKIAHPIAGNKNIAVVFVSIISVNNTPITAETATAVSCAGSRTTRFSAASKSVVSIGSRIASRLKQ